MKRDLEFIRTAQVMSTLCRSYLVRFKARTHRSSRERAIPKRPVKPLIGLKPKRAELLSFWGDAYSGAGKIEQAVKAYEEGLELVQQRSLAAGAAQEFT